VAIAAISQAQAQIYFDYYNVTGDSDGTEVVMLTVQKPAMAPAR